jgi:hypothetical protein
MNEVVSSTRQLRIGLEYNMAPIELSLEPHCRACLGRLAYVETPAVTTRRVRFVKFPCGPVKSKKPCMPFQAPALPVARLKD